MQTKPIIIVHENGSYYKGADKGIIKQYSDKSCQLDCAGIVFNRSIKCKECRKYICASCYNDWVIYQRHKRCPVGIHEITGIPDRDLIAVNVTHHHSYNGEIPCPAKDCKEKYEFDRLLEHINVIHQKNTESTESHDTESKDKDLSLTADEQMRINVQNKMYEKLKGDNKKISASNFAPPPQHVESSLNTTYVQNLKEKIILFVSQNLGAPDFGLFCHLGISYTNFAKAIFDHRYCEQQTLALFHQAFENENNPQTILSKITTALEKSGNRLIADQLNIAININNGQNQTDANPTIRQPSTSRKQPITNTEKQCSGFVPLDSRTRDFSSPEWGFGAKKARLAASDAPSTSTANRAQCSHEDTETVLYRLALQYSKIPLAIFCNSLENKNSKSAAIINETLESSTFEDIEKDQNNKTQYLFLIMKKYLAKVENSSTIDFQDLIDEAFFPLDKYQIKGLERCKKEKRITELELNSYTSKFVFDKLVDQLWSANLMGSYSYRVLPNHIKADNPYSTRDQIFQLLIKFRNVHPEKGFPFKAILNHLMNLHDSQQNTTSNTPEPMQTQAEDVFQIDLNQFKKEEPITERELLSYVSKFTFDKLVDQLWSAKLMGSHSRNALTYQIKADNPYSTRGQIFGLLTKFRNVHYSEKGFPFKAILNHFMNQV